MSRVASPSDHAIPNPASASRGGPTDGQPWVGIAANSASGRGRGRVTVERLAAELSRLGFEPRVAWTVDARRELVDSAAADREGCRCLVAVGGDGTVASLINERPEVPIAVVPAGTENLFARHFGFTSDPGRAAARIADGSREAIDLGCAAGRRFSLMAGLGFDADVVGRHHAARLGQAGILRPTHRVAYVEPVLRSSLGYRFPPLTLAVEGADGSAETLVGTTAIVFNLPRYALGLPFAPAARANDGWLDLVVFRDPGPLRALHYLWLVVRGRHLDQPGVAHRRVRSVRVEVEATVPVQLDGDPAGAITPGLAEPWVIEVIPDAIEVLVARSTAGATPAPAAAF